MSISRNASSKAYVREDLSRVLRESIDLLIRAFLSPSRACLQRLFCYGGENMVKVE